MPSVKTSFHGHHSDEKDIMVGSLLIHVLTSLYYVIFIFHVVFTRGTKMGVDRLYGVSGNLYTRDS